MHLSPLSLFSLFSFVSLSSAGLHDDLLASLSGPHITPRSWDDAYSLARVFVSKLQLGEKISLTTGTGVGLGPCSGNTQAIKRVSFPYLCLNDGPAGVRGADLVSVFPAGITTGATWDRELFYIRSRAMGVENRLKGVNIALAPVAGALGRAPDAGRNWEAFGADPWLLGVANAESVRGLQDEGVIATVKHWVANEQEHYRLVLENLITAKPILQSISSEVDERTLKELYEWPFYDAVEAGVGAVMCSYQRTNGEYSCESKTLIGNHLKGSTASGGLGFRGFVMTDWFAVSAAHLSAPAGIDMVMPGDLGGMGAVGALIPASDGALDPSNHTRLDEMAVRTVAAWYKMRQDQGYPSSSFSSWNPNSEFGIFLDRGYIGQINLHVPANPSAHKTVVRRIAAEGTVLLKNLNNTLPFRSNSTTKYAVFGSDAGPIPGGPDSCGNFGACSNGTLAMGWGSGGGTFEYLVDPLAAITEKVKAPSTVNSVLDDYNYPAIRSLASSSDVCLTFVNSRSGEATNNVANNHGDRNNLTAWYDGDTLVKEVADRCKNTIVVIHAVGPIIMEKWIDHENVKAVVHAHLPGQESGNSLVDVLWGNINPSGKLPYTVAKKENDYCCRVQKEWTGLSPKQDFTEKLLIDYKHFDSKGIEPRFEFGFGLSYTTFNYSQKLTITETQPPAGSTWTTKRWTVKGEVQNTGAREGTEVAQLYLEFPSSAPAGTPLRQLRGFDKVLVKPGEKQKVTFGLSERDLSYWDVAAKKWVVPKGNFRVQVGASSRKLLASSQITV